MFKYIHHLKAIHLGILVGILSILPFSSYAENSSFDLCTLAKETGGTCYFPPGEQTDPNWVQLFADTVFNILMGALQPTITAATPSQLPQGSTADLWLTAPKGHFTNASLVDTSCGMTINPGGVTLPSTTQLVVNVTIPTTLNVGTVCDVTVTTGTEVVKGTGVVRITAAVATPTIVSITPIAVTQDSTAHLLIYGSNTHFSNNSQIDFNDANVTVTNIQAESATVLSALLTVGDTTRIGLHDVTVTTDSEIATENQVGPLQVFPATGVVPQLLTISPNQALQGQTVTVVLQGQHTQFLDGVSTVTFEGDGITVSTVTVDETNQQVTADIQVTAHAPLGARDVHVTTSGESVTLTAGFAVFSPATLMVNQNTVSQGSEITLQITGNHTQFAQEKTQVKFANTGITVKSVTVTSPTDITAVVHIAADAPLGLVSLATFTDEEVATLAAGQTFEIVASKSETSEEPEEPSNSAPTDITLELAKSSLLEHSPVGTVVGTLTTVDSDTEDTFTYRLENTAAGCFKITGNQLQVANTDELSAGDYPVEIRTTDKQGLSFKKSFTVTVTPQMPVDKAPEVTPDSTGSPAATDGTTPVVTGETPTTSENLSPPVESEVAVESEPEQGTNIPNDATPAAVQSPPVQSPVAVTPPVSELTPPINSTATPSTPKEDVKISITCNSQQALQPAQQALAFTLPVDANPVTLTFTHVQSEPIVSEAPKGEIVDLELPVVYENGAAQVTLTPRAAGQTQLIITDCASQAIVNITVTKEELPKVEPSPTCQLDNPQLALQPATQDITLTLGDDSETLLLTGGQQNRRLVKPYLGDVADVKIDFPAAEGARLEITPRQEGQAQIVIGDCTTHQAIINITVKPKLVEESPACETDLQLEPQQLTLLADDKPITLTVTGGQGNRRLTKAPNGEVVTFGLPVFLTTGEIQFTLTPRKAGTTELAMADDCSKVNLSIRVLKQGTLADFCWRAGETEGICQNPDDKKLINFNASGIDKLGKPVQVAARFDGSTNVPVVLATQAGTVANFTVLIPSEHQGQTVEIIQLVMQQIGDQQQWFVNTGTAWELWTGELADLSATETRTLSAVLETTIDLDALFLSMKNIAGKFTVYLGYRLSNGHIIFNGTNPPQFAIANARVADSTEMPQTYFASEARGQTLSVTIQPDPAHIDKSVGILLVAESDGVWYQRLRGGAWVTWYGQLDHLNDTGDYSLAAMNKIPIFQGDELAQFRDQYGLTGKLAIYVGYRLQDDEVIIYSSEPIL